MKYISYIFAAFLFIGSCSPVLSSELITIDGLPLLRQDFFTPQEIETAVCEELLFRFFTNAGVPPNEKDTAEFLKKLNTLLPAAIPRKTEKEIQQLAKRRSNQISTAARKFFSARIPELEQVAPPELQKAYQAELQRFTTPGNLQCSAMMFRDARTAEKARAELLQGGSFDAVGTKYQAITPQNAEREFLPLLKKAHPQLHPMMISNILKGKEHYFVVRIRNFTPPAILTPDEVQACLREEIIARRTAELLTHLLKTELPKHKIEIPQIKYKVKQ
jgi:hypothetical protein